MAGVSIGWFEPEILFPDPQVLARAIELACNRGSRRSPAWPYGVSRLRENGKDTGVAFGLVRGPLPLHTDQVGFHPDNDTRVTHFVIETRNRPMLLTASVQDKTNAVFGGYTPPTDKNVTFGLGAVEMKAGQVIHFDLAKTWHGIGGMPVDHIETDDDQRPYALLVQVAGFAVTELEGAVELAARTIHEQAGIHL